MVKRIFIIHGWGGHPKEGWFPWLKKELEGEGFEVFIPQMPDADVPRINKWIPKLAEIVGVADEQTYFVGHSIGCQAILRYLESLPEGVKVGGAVFVGGFIKRLSGLEDDPEVHEVASEWLSASLDFQKVKSHINKSVAIFSDNDPYVPLDNQDVFRDKLGSKIIIEHGGGHFSGSDAKKLPSAIDAFLSILL